MAHPLLLWRAQRVAMKSFSGPVGGRWLFQEVADDAELVPFGCRLEGPDWRFLGGDGNMLQLGWCPPLRAWPTERAEFVFCLLLQEPPCMILYGAHGVWWHLRCCFGEPYGLLGRVHQSAD